MSALRFVLRLILTPTVHPPLDVFMATVVDLNFDEWTRNMHETTEHLIRRWRREV